MHFFDNLVKPKNVALIGATTKKDKLGNIILNNLSKSGVNVIPVNINTKRVGFRRTYEKISEYRGSIDLAVIAIPAQFVPSVIDDCGKKGIKSVIIISSGFGEIGNNELNNELFAKCKKHNIEVLGPNCLGIINCKNKFNASFFKGIPKYDSIAFVSQSGALGVAVLDQAIKSEDGFSKFFSVGNMLNTYFYEIIQYLEHDDETDVICLYIESVKKGKELIRVLRHIKKPIIVLKAGKSESGIRAASSHTGSLAGSNKVYKGIFKQFNVLSVNTLNEMFNLAKMLKKVKIPKSKRVCIVSNAGGPGVLASDACEFFDLEVPPLPLKIKKQLSEILPSNWSHNNPIDVIGDAKSDRFKKVFKKIKNKGFYDILLCILTPQDMTEPLKTAKALIDFAKRNKDKSVFSCFMGGNSVSDSISLLKKKGILNFSEPYEFARMISKLF